MVRKFNLIPATLAIITVILMCAFANAQPRLQKTEKSVTTATRVPQDQSIGTEANKISKDIGSVTIMNNQCGKITVGLEINSSWQLMPANNKPTYVVYKYDRAEQTDIKHSNDPVITIDWPEGTKFDIFVNARSRQTTTLGITMYRKVGEVEGYSEPCSSYVPTAGEVRLRHEQTGKCMFGDPNDGGTVKTFTCWKDPNMSYFLEPISGNEVRLRHKSTGKCVYGNSVNGGIAKNWICWDDPNMVFVKEPLPGNDRFRLRHKSTGRCIYGGSVDGAAVKNWGPCWDDPAMVWVAEPF